MNLAKLGGLKADSHFGVSFSLGARTKLWNMKIHMSYTKKNPYELHDKTEHSYMSSKWTELSMLSTALPPAAFRRSRKCDMLSAWLPTEGRFAVPAAQDRRTVRHGHGAGHWCSHVWGTWQGILGAGSYSSPQLPPPPFAHSIGWSQVLQGDELTWKIWWQHNREREKFWFLSVVVMVKRDSEGCSWVFEMK